jgi:DNA modification methylase
MFDDLEILSPKRNSHVQTGWEGFFPYYAGYPETFAEALLKSARLNSDAIVLDPWNGSGTTTYTASMLGLASRGLDINPVMVVIARSRLLPASEADSIEPLAKEVLRMAYPSRLRLDASEPLKGWFSDRTATSIRSIERSICKHFLGGMTITPTGTNLDRISGLAATFYVALFSVCRDLVAPFRSSNPTWLRRPKDGEERIDIPHRELTEQLRLNLRSMATALAERAERSPVEHVGSEIRLADTTTAAVTPDSVDFILTSPPYCTRIDYTAATRIELAVMGPLCRGTPEDLSRRMIGSTRVSKAPIETSLKWGSRCIGFLDALRNHPSKASGGYYYLTHLDYFDKMERSIEKVATILKPGGRAVLVVQDSYYKDIHNDLPTMIADIGESHGLTLSRREDFHLQRSMSGINPHTRRYQRKPGAVEAVLCFHK